ncbi:MAG: PKD domain-containing protein, partial [Bacteroidales bacterium]
MEHRSTSGLNPANVFRAACCGVSGHLWNNFRIDDSSRFTARGFNPLMAAFLVLTMLAGVTVASLAQPPRENTTQSVLAPTATIYSSQTEVCLGSSVTAYLYFSGDGPWDVEVSDKDSVYLSLTGVTSPHAIQLQPTKDNVYSITRVVDTYGVVGTPFGSVELSVNPITPVTILMDRKAFLVTESGIQLTADPAGGSFTGVGVSANKFYPRIATPVGSPHTITYTYYNQFGCASKDEAEVYVLYGEGGVWLLDGTDTVDNLCDDGRTYQISGDNRDGLAGSFELREAGSGNSVEGYLTDEDPNDNEATLNPAGLQGSFDIVYSYGLEGLDLTRTFRFAVNSLNEITVPGLPENVCSSDDPYPLVPDLAEEDNEAVYTFTGPGVIGDQEEGYFFDPGSPDAVMGSSEILLNYSASNGCSAEVSFTVSNRFSPNADFTLSPVCLPSEGGTLEFQNTTTTKDSVERWAWNFGDPDSGPDNTSNQENPSHLYATLGQVEISLTATATSGCVSVHSVDTVLSDQPIADFTWLTDCFVSGKKITFLNRSESVYAPIDTLIWTFRTADGGFLGMIGSSSDTVEFPFTVRDTYTVGLQVENGSGCQGETSKEIELQPTIRLTAGYREDFNGATTTWHPMSADTTYSWTRAVPDFTGFEPETGDRAWFTDLPLASDDYLEASWVQSPCFDFRSRQNPLIKLDLMRSFIPGFDGAVLQYQEVSTEPWKTIGSIGEGSNWYNMNSLLNKPGGSSMGWGLQLFDPDMDWVTATHDLDMLAGLPHVRLRLAVATGGQREMGNQGFAFDNVFIGDRVRTSVLEHFTNASSFLCADADDITDAFATANPGSVIDIQFHTAFPGDDPMNENNPYPASTRVFNYGIQEVPYAMLNGGVDPGTVYDFSGPGSVPNDDALKQASLELPDFNVDLQVNWMEGNLETKATVTCLADTFASNVQLYVVVIETDVTAYTGANLDNEFRNVVLDMLPSPNGTLLGKGWSAWMARSQTYSWPYASFLEDVDDLAVVAFIQNRDNGQILQATASYNSPQVGTVFRSALPAQLRLYPNP